ncbi:lantibiotic immunity ABC transporter MutG family permease subunit [Paenibacillus sp. PK3_47]|uniref:lantibiotic immunity ABC transporter MutG family permease subunit n=1 Tax=Paenibacillus sp. PK3_47 TaxID=2072642 RepID=UPI00201D7295|nr:lantibiotic immunity ABC transporter MutG family permease subunit [Paenibacillus sp. PK3_47]UQZ35300.1 lantibiotic immunity ABC transporter MutG family permease subunit [Paenibacillus sp. PK3_47]
MASITKLLSADLLKTRRTPFLLIHLLAPLTAAGLFLAYYSYSPWSSSSKILAFLQVLACALPTLIGLACAMAAEQEASAGRFQGMLALPGRKLAVYISKLLLLLLFGLGSLLLACLLFGAGFHQVLRQDGPGLLFYGNSALILSGSSIFLYLLHSFLSLRYGKGLSIGTGIVGSLVAALLLTGLGDGIWPFVPFAWGARFSSLWSVYTSGVTLSSSVSGLDAGIAACAAGTLLAAVLSCFWFLRWEGGSADN